MALGDPILVNLGSASFLLTAETGVIIQSSDRSVDSNWKDVFDASKGYDVGFVAFNFKAQQDFNAIVNGTTGLTLAQPGVVLTLANDLGIGTNKNGVSAGGQYVRSVRVSHQGEDLRMLSGSAVQKQNIA